MLRSTSGIRRACVVGSTIALIGLTSGLGVLGASAAYAVDVVPPVTEQPVTEQPAPSTDPGTSADETPSTGDAAGTTDPGVPSTDGSDPSGDAAGTSGDQAPGTGTDPADDGSGDTSVPPTDTGAHHGTGTGTRPAATGGDTTDADAPAADLVVTIAGKAKVGSTLTATATGFTGTLHYAWTVGGEPRTEASSNYAVTTADAGGVVTVTITGDAGQEQSASTDPVTQDAAFTEGTDVLHPVRLSITAGDLVERDFAATGFPTPTYALGDLNDDALDEFWDAQGDDGFFIGDWSVPEDLTIDPVTGHLSGMPTSAGTYVFQVEATSGTTTALSYVELTIKPAAAVGLVVQAFDEPSLYDVFEDGGDARFWVILPDGESEEVHVVDGETVGHKSGALPHVLQGGVLSVEGLEFDEYFNPVGFDDEGNLPVSTVTSSDASDVITVNEDEGTVQVRFPNASTHTLTVAGATTSLSFPVRVDAVTPPAVTPPVATLPGTTPAVVVTPTATRGSGQLAYTGSDDSSLAVWALGLLAAGVGVTGLRIARRRAQR